MHIGAVDAAATMGRSPLHAASPVAKLLAFAALLTAAVVSWNVVVLAGVLVVLAAAVTRSGVRTGLAYGLAAYPAVFAAIFALASAPGLLAGFTMVLKAAVAGLAAIVVVLTTPYPQIFAPLQRVVPGIVGDALLMTYRSTFLLLDKFSNLLTAVRLRSGLSLGHPVRAVHASTRALGGLLLYSFDLSQRDYDIMRLRGYQGRLRVPVPASTQPVTDAALVAGCVLVAATSIAWRLLAEQLNPYSWLVLVPAVAVYGAALIAVRRNR